MFKKVLSLIVVLGLLAAAGTALADLSQCDKEVLDLEKQVNQAKKDVMNGIITEEQRLNIENQYVTKSMECIEERSNTLFKNPTENLERAMERQAEAIIAMFGFLLVVAFIIWIIPCIVCGVAAKRKGLSAFWFFVFSFIFSPLIGLLAVIAMSPKQRR